MCPGVSSTLDFELSDFELFTLERRFGIFDCAGGIGTMQDASAGQFSQDGRPGHQILVAMGFEDMGDLQPLGARHFDIAFAVAARIDDGGLSARTDQVGQVGQAGCLDFLE